MLNLFLDLSAQLADDMLATRARGVPAPKLIRDGPALFPLHSLYASGATRASGDGGNETNPSQPQCSPCAGSPASRTNHLDVDKRTMRWRRRQPPATGTAPPCRQRIINHAETERPRYPGGPVRPPARTHVCACGQPPCNAAPSKRTRRHYHQTHLLFFFPPRYHHKLSGGIYSLREKEIEAFF